MRARVAGPAELAKIRRPISATEPRNEADRKLAAAILGDDGSDDEASPMPPRAEAARPLRDQGQREVAGAAPAAPADGARSWPPSVSVPPLALPGASGMPGAPAAAARTASGSSIAAAAGGSEEGLAVAVAALAARIAELEGCLELDPRAATKPAKAGGGSGGQFSSSAHLGEGSAAAMVLADEREQGRHPTTEGQRAADIDSGPVASVWAT